MYLIAVDRYLALLHVLRHSTALSCLCRLSGFMAFASRHNASVGIAQSIEHFTRSFGWPRVSVGKQVLYSMKFAIFESSDIKACSPGN